MHSPSYNSPPHAELFLWMKDENDGDISFILYKDYPDDSVTCLLENEGQFKRKTAQRKSI